jgi:hypothetical protein
MLYMPEEYYYVYERPRKPDEDDEVKTDFVVLIDHASVADVLFAHVIEGYKLPYSYETIEADDDVYISEYTFPIDCLDVIKVIIDMRSIHIIKIV